jgi:cell division protein FtsW (lipid II flippase)
MLPVTGPDLPFLSFGGTSLLVTMTAAGCCWVCAEQPVSS